MCELFLMYYSDQDVNSFIICNDEEADGNGAYIPYLSRCDENAILADAVTMDKHIEDKYLKLSMPGAKPTKEDDYLCSAFSLKSMARGMNNTKVYLTSFDVNANSSTVGHVGLIRCNMACSKEGVYNCQDPTEICGSNYRQQALIYDWGKDAGPITLPTDVGFEVDVIEDTIVMQVHYKVPLDFKDLTSAIIKYTEKKPKYRAGMLMLQRRTLKIPPGAKNITAEMNCKVCSFAVYFLQCSVNN